MLDQNELDQIGQVVSKVMFDEASVAKLELIVGKVIDEKVPPIVERIIDEKVPEIVRGIFQEEMSSVMEHQIMPQFDLLHDRIDGTHTRIDSLDRRFDNLDARVDRMDRKITTQIASKGWVEERLDRFSADHRLQYKPAM